MRIVFMGTPDFAVLCLKSLIAAGHEVAAVFTRKDKPKGRKQTLTPPPVKVTAVENGIPIFQPDTLRNAETTKIIADLKPDIIVVAAYGMILPKAVLDIPPYGCVNVHASLLPKYRGAAPIQRAIINGDKVTGVTTMQMAEGIDTGDILLCKSIKIGADETSELLTARLSVIGAELIVQTLDALKNGTVKPVPQDNEKSSYASMLTKELSPIDWNKTAGEIHNLVRGLVPWPTASTVYQGKRLKIYSSKIVTEQKGAPGLVVSGNGLFTVCCGGKTALELLEVQAEGGKRMSGKDFLRGHPAKQTDVLQMSAN